MWRRDGRELFYVAEDRLMAVDVDIAPRLDVRPPRQLFTGELEFDSRSTSAFDVSLDGQRFLVMTRADDAPPALIQIVVSWFEELERLVSTDE